MIDIARVFEKTTSDQQSLPRTLLRDRSHGIRSGNVLNFIMAGRYVHRHQRELAILNITIGGPSDSGTQVQLVEGLNLPKYWLESHCKAPG